MYQQFVQGIIVQFKFVLGGKNMGRLPFYHFFSLASSPKIGFCVNAPFVVEYHTREDYEEHDTTVHRQNKIPLSAPKR